jgi:gag-polyprotein putative aspartyl protease
VLDTGAVFTTITPEMVDLVGYGVRDGTRRTRVRTAVGSEEGFLLEVARLDVLGLARPQFPVHVFDLGHDDIDGLLGLNFLSELNDEVRSAERRILVEEIEPAAPARSWSTVATSASKSRANPLSVPHHAAAGGLIARAAEASDRSTRRNA